MNRDTIPGVSRRRLLRTAVNVGVGAGLVRGFGAEYASPDTSESIVYAMARPAPDRPSLEPRTKEVPGEWYESLKSVLDIQRRLREALPSSLVGSFVVPGSYDDPEASISIDATDESIQETIADLVEDVAIDVNVIDELPPKPKSQQTLADSYQVSDLDARRVPSGVVCKAGELFATLAPAMYDARRRVGYFATSNHVYGDAGAKETEHRGEPLSLVHEDETRHVGRVRRGYPAADVVRIAPVDGYQPTSEIARTSPSAVIGQYTVAGLADLMASGEKLRKVGALSGHTAGEIKGIDGITCYVGRICKRGQLKWGDARTMVDGDSGSVSYHEDPEHPGQYVLVGGINNARSWWPGAEFCWGTAAHHLLDEYGLHF